MLSDKSIMKNLQKIREKVAWSSFNQLLTCYKYSNSPFRRGMKMEGFFCFGLLFFFNLEKMQWYPREKGIK